MSINIPEEIQEALTLIRNEAEDRMLRQMAGLKIGLWVLAEKDACVKDLDEEKERVKAATVDTDPAEGLAEIVKSLQIVGEIQQRFDAADKIFDEVSGYMEQFKAEIDSEDGEEQTVVHVNGKRTDITRVTKNNKNDGDKGIIPA